MTSETKEFILATKKLHSAIVEYVLSNDMLAETDESEFNLDTSIATVIPVLAKYIAKSFGNPSDPKNFEIARLFELTAQEIDNLIDTLSDDLEG